VAFAPLCIILLDVCVCVFLCVCRHNLVATVTRFLTLRWYLRNYVSCNDRVEAKDRVLVTKTVYCEIRDEAEETVDSTANYKMVQQSDRRN
jgi:hypothetical protein